MDTLGTTKKKQKVMIIGGIGALVSALVIGLYVSDPDKGKPDPRSAALEIAKEVRKNFSTQGSESVSAEELWISRSEKRLSALEKEKQQLEEKVAEFEKQSLDMTKKIVPGFNQASSVLSSSGIVPPVPKAPISPAELRQESVNARFQTAETGAAVFPPVPRASLVPAKLVTGKSATNAAISAEPAKTIFVDTVAELPVAAPGGDGHTGKHYSRYMPAGSFAKAVLLQGVDAPTGGLANTNPVPVLLRLIDFGRLPNFFESDIKNCHATAAAVGDLSSERVYMRTEKLSCILENGDVVEVNIRGTLAGEDGKAGVRGTVVSKQGAMIARAALAGLASGIGQSVEQQYQQTSTSPLGSVTTIDSGKAVEAGLAKGFSNSMERIADFWIARANETYPIIEIGSKRIVEIVLTEGVDFGTDIVGKVRMKK